MACRKSDPLWAVRGVHREEDVTLVIEASKQIHAECFATKRGIEVIFVGEASLAEVEAARASGRLWRYTPVPALTCLGRPIGFLQTAFLVVCGLATVAINLKVHQVHLKLW